MNYPPKYREIMDKILRDISNEVVESSSVINATDEAKEMFYKMTLLLFANLFDRGLIDIEKLASIYAREYHI